MIEGSSDFFDKEDINAVNKSLGGSVDYVVGERIYLSDSGFYEIHLGRRAGRLFILKSLKQEYKGNNVAEAALHKEFQIGFMIDNPGVARTFDFSSNPDIGSFIALEYCRGINLREFIDSGKELSFDQLEKISHDLIETVREIHSEGVLHRDIKPSNIIFDELRGAVKLIDFGCADTFDQSMFKGRAGTELYQSADFSNQPENDWYALSLTLSELADHCHDKRKKHLFPLFDIMRNGLDPSERSKPQRKRLWIFLILAIIAIVGTVLFFYLRSRSHEEPIITNEGATPTEVNDTISSGINGDDVDMSENNLETLSPDSERAEGPENKKEPEKEKEDERAGKSEKGSESNVSPGNPAAVETTVKNVDTEGIDPEAIEEMKRRIRGIAYDVYHEREDIYQHKMIRENASQNELSDLEGELFNEAACTRAIMGRIRHFPPGVPMDTIRKIVKANYNFYFHYHIPIYERYDPQYRN